MCKEIQFREITNFLFISDKIFVPLNRTVLNSLYIYLL
jgi:hypothetical protein